MPRAKSPDSTPRHTPVRAGRAASGDNWPVSTGHVLLGVAVALLLLVWVLRDLVLLVGYSVLVAYALRPVVTAIERPLGSRGLRIPRTAAAAMVILALVTTVGWLLVLAVPRLAAQAARFATGAPEGLAWLVKEMRAYSSEHGLSVWMVPAIEHARVTISGWLQNMAGTLAGWTGLGFSDIGQVAGLALLPVLAFYLLAEPTAVRLSALRFVPKAARPEIARLGGAVDRALRGYVRGQAIICLVMAVTVGLCLALLGSPVALLLGLLVGFAELVPYLGFLVAALAIGLVGLTGGPLHALAGVAVYFLINWAIGTFVAPRVMGRYLKMHPFVVTVSILAGTQIFGPAGALLGLPGAAVIQAVIGELALPDPPRSPASAPDPAETRHST